MRGMGFNERGAEHPKRRATEELFHRASFADIHADLRA